MTTAPDPAPKTADRSNAVVWTVGILLIAGGIALYVRDRAAPPIAKPKETGDYRPPPKIDPAPFATEEPLFPDWPDAKPTLAFVVTGEMLGYLQPCGCSEGQAGGLSRRAGILSRLRKDFDGNVVALDFGDVMRFKPPGLQAVERRRFNDHLERLRFDAALDSLKALNYSAVGIGPQDLNTSLLWLLGPAANTQPMRFTAANLTSRDANDQDVLEQVIAPTVEGETAGVTWSAAAVIDDSQNQDLFDRNVKLLPLTTVIPDILKRMDEKKPRLKILLAYMAEPDAHKLATTHPSFDLILCKSRADEATANDAKQVGKTLVAWVGKKGTTVGVVGYWQDQDPPLRFAVLAVNKRFEEDKKVDELYARFVRKVKDDGYLAKWARVDHTSGDAYVGAAECGKCHKKAYAKWQTTKHAHATETLLHHPKLDAQAYNPECVQCHSTGMEFKGGFMTPKQSPLLHGNQCENCHGPGKRHAQEPNNMTWRTQVRRSKFTADIPICRSCHDLDNSPKFKFDEFWSKVAHPWRD